MSGFDFQAEADKGPKLKPQMIETHLGNGPTTQLDPIPATPSQDHFISSESGSRPWHESNPFLWLNIQFYFKRSSSSHHCIVQTVDNGIKVLNSKTR